MSSFNVFAEAQKFAEAMRCASPLSSSVDVPVSSRPKVWRNEDCPTVISSRSIDGLCKKIEERLDLGTECQDTSEYSGQIMTSAPTFEERCRNFDDLVYWVKDCQRRHAENEPFIGVDGKLVGEMAARPRYRLGNKVHSKFFAIAIESSGEETMTNNPTVRKVSAAQKSPPVMKRTPDKLFPPKNFTPAKLYTPTEKVAPVKKVASIKRVTGENDGYEDGVRVRDFAIYSDPDKRKSFPIRKSTSTKKMALVKWTACNNGEVKVRDFAYTANHKTPKPATTARRSRREAFLKAG